MAGLALLDEERADSLLEVVDRGRLAGPRLCRPEDKQQSPEE
jgi:hypothetical protein